jgi:hypothetical protein
MLTTDGLTFAARVAMSGVPASTGGLANGAGAWGDAAVADGWSAAAACWQPVPSDKARRVGGMSFRAFIGLA